MTAFEQWVKTQDPAFTRDMFSAAAAFQAAQQAEREKYQELIAATEAIIGRWDRYVAVVGGGPMEKMLRDALENLKGEAE